MVQLSVTEYAKFIGCTVMTVHNRRKTGKINTIKTTGNGGEQYRIILTPKEENRYLGISEVTETGLSPQQMVNNNLELYMNLKKWQQEYIDEWVIIITETKDFTKNQIRAYIQTFVAKSSKIKLSLSTYYKNRAAYQTGGVAALAPSWGKKTNQIDPRLIEMFERVYLKEQGAPASKCHSVVIGYAKTECPDIDVLQIPQARAFVSFLEKKYTKPFINYKRKGERFYKRNHEAYIPRDWSTIEAGSWWVSDHHQLDIICTDNGTTVRPWVTVWMDLRTNKILSAYIHTDSPNSDHILMALAWAIKENGLPDGIYLDNGKDYRVLDFTGNPKRYKYWNDDTEHHTRALMTKLDIKIIFAREYNAQAKPIEPRFKAVINGFSKFSVGYTSSTVVTRPETLAKEIKNNEILSFADIKNSFEYYISNIYNQAPSNGNLLKGLSPQQAFVSFRKKTIRKLSDNSMPLLYMRGKEVTIRRKMIFDKSLGFETIYTAEELYKYEGKKVYIRRDMRKWNEAWLFDATTDQFLCIATLQNRMPGIITDASKQDLQTAYRAKLKDIKQARTATKTQPIQLSDIMKYQAASLTNSKGTACSAPAEIIHTTELDIAHKTVTECKKKKEIIENFDITEFVPADRPVTSDEDFDIWNLKEAYN